MKVRKKTKMCWHCNGINPYSALECAYCGAALQQDEETSSQETFAPPYEIQETVSSQMQMDFSEDQTPQSPNTVTPQSGETGSCYSVYDQPDQEQRGHLMDELSEKEIITDDLTTYPSEEEVASAPAANEMSFFEFFKQRMRFNSSRIKQEGSILGESVQLIFPIFLFSVGFLFAVFGFALVFLGHEGQLTLIWNTERWPIFLVSSVPMIYFAWKMLPDLQENDS